MSFEPILSEILIGVGIFLITMEIFMPNFVIIWFGISSIVIGLVGFLFTFENGLHQIALISIIGLALLLFFREKIKTHLNSKKSKVNDDFLKEEGFGIVSDNNMIAFRGTLWHHNLNQELKKETKVKILSVKDNIVILDEKES